MPPDGSRTGAPRRSLTFYETVTAAVADMAAHGYDRATRLEKWTAAIRAAANREMVPAAQLERETARLLRDTFKRMVGESQILQYHKGINRFTLDRVKPKLRRELDRRILANASLIKMNREEAINVTLRRFSGWATSIPVGGSDVVDKLDTKANIGKALKQLPFEVRRVNIDQGHKFIASLNEILAEDGGAIAAQWYSHWRQAGYNYRKDHKGRDRKYYAVRGNWALEAGLMTKGDGYTDEMTKPGEEVFCRCAYTWVYSLEYLPKEMLTRKGAEMLAKAEAA